jgi:hypothetical protein
MTTNNWTNRVSARNSPQDLLDIRTAARDLGQEAHHLPGRTRLVFQNVSQCVILASVAATASLALFHLWKELSREHDRAHPNYPSGSASDDGHKRGRG